MQTDLSLRAAATSSAAQVSPSKAIEELRALLSRRADGAEREHWRGDLYTAAVYAFLHLKVNVDLAATEAHSAVTDASASTEGGAPIPEEEDEEALRAYPSEHTCLVCNVLAFESLLREGGDSRFLARGTIPACYLACTCNFDRDSDTGEIFSYEIASKAHQETIRDEAQQFEAVRFCLDPLWRDDWLSYFQQRYCLLRVFEIYKGDAFVRNQSAPTPCAKGEAAFGPVFTLRRSTLDSFDADTAQEVTSSRQACAGCVVAFRQEASDKEPFGMWFGWLRCNEYLLVVDIQNSLITTSLTDSIRQIDWSQPPRPEVFWAPLNIILE